MSQLLTLYFDTISKTLCGGINGPDFLALPDFYQEDSISLELTVLKRISYTRAPLFEVQQVAGRSLTIAVGTADNILAQQNSFTVSGSKFQGTLDLNTEGISGLADGTEVFTEIIVYDGASPYRARFPQRVFKSVVLAASLVPVPGDTALGLLQADRTYVRKEMRAGESILWKSLDGLKTTLQYLDNDGTMRFEPIT